MSFTILFYLVLLSQIILVSYYYPKVILNRIKYIVETYPPSQFPKFYPGGDGTNMQRKFKSRNLFILLAGLALLVVAFLSGYSPTGTQGRLSVVFYFMLQMAPFMLLGKSELRQFKLMREANSQSARKTELQARRLFNFISPLYMGLAIFLYLAFVIFELNLLFGDHDALTKLIGITVCQLFFVGVGVLTIYGKKQNPHTVYKDRLTEIGATLNVLVFGSIAMSIFTITSSALEVFNLDYLEPVLTSAYFQITLVFGIGTMLRTLKIDAIDFEVYRGDAAAA